MTKKHFSRPRDKSLQAYKDWINGIVSRIFPDAEDTMSIEKWVEKWKKFWAQAEGKDKDPTLPRLKSKCPFSGGYPRTSATPYSSMSSS